MDLDVDEVDIEKLSTRTLKALPKRFPPYVQKHVKRMLSSDPDRREMSAKKNFEIGQNKERRSSSFLFGLVFLSLWLFRFGLHGWDNGIFLDDWAFYGNPYIFDTILPVQTIISCLYRPLAFFLFFSLSRLWENFQIVHLISSALHGVNAVLIFWIAKRLFGRAESYICCLFLLLFPIPSEAVYWASIIHNVLGVTIGSASILLAFKYGANGIYYKLILTAMALLSAALYEQSAMLFCVSIGVCLLQEIKEKSWQLKRLSLCLLPLIGLGVYFIFFRITTATLTGDRFSLNPLHLIPSKYGETLITYMKISLFGWVAQKFLWNGFWDGIHSIVSKWWLLLVFIGTLFLATGVTWVQARERERGSSWRPLTAFIVSLGIILVTLSIFSLTRESWFSFRVTYAPSVGLSLLVGLLVGVAFRLIKHKKWSQWYHPAVVLLLVFAFLPVNYSELTQYRRQRDLDICQAQQIQSYFPQIDEGAFFWLLNIPWETQKVTVFYNEHILNIWAAGDWGTKFILSCMYRKRVDGKPLHSGKSILPSDLPPSFSNTYVLWFDKGSFYPVYEIVLLATSGENRKYRFPLMEQLADSHQKRVITLEAGDQLDRYPNSGNSR